MFDINNLVTDLNSHVSFCGGGGGGGGVVGRTDSRGRALTGSTGRGVPTNNTGTTATVDPDENYTSGPSNGSDPAGVWGRADYNEGDSYSGDSNYGSGSGR